MAGAGCDRPCSPGETCTAEQKTKSGPQQACAVRGPRGSLAAELNSGEGGAESVLEARRWQCFPSRGNAALPPPPINSR